MNTAKIVKKYTLKCLPAMVVLAAVCLLCLAWPLTAWAADNVISKTVTAIDDGGGNAIATVTITNNYAAADIIELSLEKAPSANETYWFYGPGGISKATQLGSITIKRGTLNGRLVLSSGKLSDYKDSYVTITDGAGASLGLYKDCNYEAAGTTAAADYNSTSGNVTLRNCDGGAALLCVDKSVVVPGLTVVAVVDGRLYKGSAKLAGKDFQVSLAKNMEIDTPVWYSIAYSNCQYTDFYKLELGEVETTGGSTTPIGDVFVFYQGDNLKTSSILITGVKPADIIRCYDDRNVLLKTVTVGSGVTTANLAGLTLIGGSSVYITVTEKGNYESVAEAVAVPTATASPSLKSGNIAVVNSLADGTAITIKNIEDGDTVKIYNAQGVLQASGTGVADGDGIVTAAITIDPALSAGNYYFSLTKSGQSESPWFSYKIGAPK